MLNRDDMLIYVNRVFRALGVNHVEVKIISIGNSIAYTDGVKTLLNDINGNIYVNDVYLNNNSFTDDEIRFILGHECIHIIENHWLIRDLSLGLQNVIVSTYPNLAPFLDMVRNLTIIFSPLGIPYIESLVRQQELDADYKSTLMIGDLRVAVNCLSKLCNNNFQQPSHLWEYKNLRLPIMTMRERIDALIMRFDVDA